MPGNEYFGFKSPDGKRAVCDVGLFPGCLQWATLDVFFYDDVDERDTYVFVCKNCAQEIVETLQDAEIGSQRDGRG